jgi:Uma2 family endonuclease
MDTPRHRLQMNVLIESLEDAWQDRYDFYVGGNMFVYFSELQAKNDEFRGPDVFVVLDTEKKQRKSWVAWEEGGKLPDVVIELTSSSTTHIDHGEKKRIYAKVWRSAAYFIYDAETQEFEAYRLDSEKREYVPVDGDERGDVLVAPLGLKLGIRPAKMDLYDGPFLRWIDEQGEPLPTARERAKQEWQRAEQERQRADRAEARARELEEELSRARRG